MGWRSRIVTTMSRGARLRCPEIGTAYMLMPRPARWEQGPRRGDRGAPRVLAICMLVPVPRGFAETLNPRIELLRDNPELEAKYKAWEASRSGFLTGLKTNDPDAVKRGWQKDYFQGKTLDGGAFEGHQTKVNLKEFEPPKG